LAASHSASPPHSGQGCFFNALTSEEGMGLSLVIGQQSLVSGEEQHGAVFFLMTDDY
jgi:hypothetical protein